MAGPYENALVENETLSAIPPDASSPYAAGLAAEAGQKRTQLRTTMLGATQSNPDQFAEAKKLAIQTGIPAEVVERNLPEVKQQAAGETYDAMVQKYPSLAKFLSVPDFAKLTHDDLDTLTKVESTVIAVQGEDGKLQWAKDWRAKETDSVQASKGPEPTFGSVASGIAKSLGQGAESAKQGIVEQFADLIGSPELKKDAQRKYAQAQFDTFLSTPSFESSTASGLYSGATSTVRMLPGLAASIATKSPTPVLAAMGVQTEAEAYGKYTGRGATPGEALTGATGEGAVEVLTEIIPMSYFVKKFGKAGFSEFFGGVLARELPTEQLATVLQDALDTAIANPDKTWAEYAAERPDAAYQTLLATLVQSSVMGGAGATARHLAQRQGDEDKTNANADALAQVMSLSNEAKLNQRSKPDYAAFVDDAAKNGPFESVYVDAATFQQAATEAGIDIAKSMPETAAAIQDAIETKSDVRIPLGEFASTIPGTTLEQSIIPFLKTDPDGSTQQEISDTKWVEDTKKQTERIMAEQDYGDKWKESTETVKGELLSQLKQANRFTNDVNSAYASYAAATYSVLAHRLGITPEEMYVKYPLQITAQGLPGENTLTQGFDPVEIAALTAANGGGMWNVNDGQPGKGGFAVSPYKSRERVIPGQATPAQIAAYSAQNKDLLSQENNYLGTWFNPADGSTYLDVSTLVPDLETALRLGRRSKQLAVYDMEGGKTVDVPEAATAQKAAEDYMTSRGLSYNPPAFKVKLDTERAERIAQAYDSMANAPTDPKVAEAYVAMIDEVLAQWKFVEATGLKVEMLKEGQADPYAKSPQMAIDDVLENNHLWVFPTSRAFGNDTKADTKNNPLLAETDVVIDGQKLLANDVFRIVHDYFGHVKDNNGFRAEGEENAWRDHSAMFSPLAQRALTTETRGQNSWLNFGPHGEKNRTAKSADTIYAPQKVGLLPLWVSQEGKTDGIASKGQTTAYGAITPNSISVMAVHFSPHTLTAIDSGQYGTGMKDAAAERVANQPDERIKKRVYFYVPKGAGVQAESGVGGKAYGVRLHNLYDTDTDPLKLVKQNKDESKMESAILDAGFEGYYSGGRDSKQGFAVLLGKHSVPVVPLGNQTQANAALGAEGTLNQTVDQTDTPEFKAWFGDSKVVDAEGKPLVVYHGTDAEFDTFKKGKNVNFDNAQRLLGFFFAEDKQYAQQYGAVKTLHLTIKNPFVAPSTRIDAIEGGSDRNARKWVKSLKDKGYDGVKFGTGATAEWVAFEPTQIKSAIGNRGTFDPNNPNILYQEPSSEWYYSELARQIDLVKMNAAPAKGWKDFIRGLVQKGVKQAEIDAVGINEWLDLQAERPLGWLVISPEGKATATLSNQESAEQVAKNRDDGSRVQRENIKVDKAEVQQFLKDGGVQVEETILDGNEGGYDEPSYSETDSGIDDPDPSYLEETARDNYYDQVVTELAERDGVEEDEVDEEEANKIARERALESYYEDDESPRSSSATYTVNGNDYDFYINYSYGETYISYNGREVNIERRESAQEAIESFVGESLGDYPNDQENGGTQYADYQLDGERDDYFELLLKLPGTRKFDAPHFNDSENLLAHARINTRYVDIDAAAFPELAARKPNQKAKVLFVEEIQSDWAQQGKDKGFKFKPSQRHLELQRKVDSGDFTTEELAERDRLQDREGAVDSGDIEPAPFVTKTEAWTGLVTKRLVRYAAENDFDLISWTRGDQQVHRWSGALRKRVDYIEWVKTEQGVQLLGYKNEYDRPFARPYVEGNSDDGFVVYQGAEILGRFTTHEEASTFAEASSQATSRKVVDTTYKEDALSDAIGKTMGKQILEDPSQTGVIEGDNITIDSIGMSQFYGDAHGRKGDGTPSIITNTIQKVLKAKVGSVEVDVGKQYGTFYTYQGPEHTLEQMEVILYDRELKPGDVAITELIVNSMRGGSTFQEAVKGILGDYGLSGYIQQVLGGDLRLNSIPNLQPAFEVTPEMKTKALSGVPLFQDARGQITFGADIKQQPTVITLLATANLSTFLHEMGHFQLEMIADITSQPNAPAEIVADFNTVMQWFGVTADQWRGMTLEQKRPYHEQWARGMESYLFEGKSPSLELQSLFARFRSWLINVYRQLQQLNVTLTPEVRGVMDRLVATNEQIMQAETARNYGPMFETKPEGMSEADWGDYQNLSEDSTQEAAQQLQTRSLRDMQYASNAKAAVLKRLQAQATEKRKAIRAEVSAEVRAEKVYNTIRGLRKGWVQDDGSVIKIKLSVSALAEMYPATNPSSPDLTKLSGMTKADGMHPDQVAELTGFSSGDELARKLIDAEPERQKIDGITDQRMLERYGDLADPASLEKAANAAIHNDVRAKFVATELRTLDKAVGNLKLLAKAAKEYAAALVSRKKLRTIKPKSYEAAEARSSKNAHRALLAGDQTTAATEKRTQLVNLYAARASYDALDEIDKGVAYLKRIGDSKTLDPEYRTQIETLLERFDLRAVSAKDAARRVSLVQWIEAQKAVNMETAIDPQLENEAYRKPYQDMTLEEFRGLRDSIKNIEHLGRLKHKLLTLKDQREFKAVVDEAAQAIEDNAKRTLPVRLESNQWGDKARTGVAKFFAIHYKFARMIREMDGWQDNGVLWNLFSRPMNEAGDNEAVLREQATIKLAELFKPIFEAEGALISVGRRTGQLLQGEFKQAYRGHLAQKMFIPEINNSLSREGRIVVALNNGTDGNLQRLMDGDHWTPVQIEAILDTLTKEEMDFVQSVWDFIGSYRDQVGAQQKRLTGLEPAWIEPRRVVTKHGEYAGGYFPAKYDVQRSTRSLADEAASNIMDQWRAKYGAAKARASFVKERANKVVNRPLRKDFGVVFQHITEVTHRLAWQDFLTDANRLLRASAIDDAIRTHYGPEVLEEMRKTIEDVAIGDVPAQNVFQSSVNYVRTGATVAGLGWRLTTSLLQPLGLSQSMVRIGPKWIAKGLGEWLGDAAKMENTVARIGEKSDFMRLRAKTMQREISEIRNKVSGKDSAIEASYFYLIQKMQLVSDVPTWLGQYAKAIESGVDEDNAVGQADQAVRDAQGSGQLHDLSAIQRGGPLQKLFTNFYSFFNTTYNLTGEAVGRTNFKDPIAVGRLAVDFLLLYSVPAALGTLMKWSFTDDDDEDKLVKTLIADQMSYLLGTMVGIREFAGIARSAAELPAEYGGPASMRVVGEVTKLSKQLSQGEIDEALLKSANNVGGILFHYPAGQVNATADGIVSLASGKTDNPGVLAVGSSKK